MITTLLYIIIILLFINIIITILKKVSLNIKPQLKDIENSIIKFDNSLDKNEKLIKDEFQRNRIENNNSFKIIRDDLTKSLNSFELKFSENVNNLNKLIHQNFSDFGKQQMNITKISTDTLRDVKLSVEKKLQSIRDDNTQQLDRMRKTVDEKLQTTLEKRLGESFKQVSDRLEQVHKGLGEMQNIATGVGDLKKVLSNVKNKGVLGEIQLQNILEQILTPDQYGKNVATKKGSQANVEFAIKLPGNDSQQEVWMPIDSKFPSVDYERLNDAFDEGDKEKIKSIRKDLFKTIEKSAKDINSKYIDPPHTTDFAVMFLPFEGLYAEVLRHPGLFEKLQTEYKITIAGPTTLSALLNSLQMGFRTLAVQKRSSEVWDVLRAVKTEFGTFSDVLTKVHGQINTASNTLETLKTTRLNQMSKKLIDVETITTKKSNEILNVNENILNK